LAPRLSARYATAMIRRRAAILADAPLLRRWDAEPHVIAAKTSPPADASDPDPDLLQLRIVPVTLHRF
jgi:hypothetical protein